MLALFPAAYPDELLYSLCARYARLVGYPNPRDNVRTLFGRGTITAVVTLPTCLEHLAARLAPLGGPDVGGLIDQHTLLPYYAGFHSVEKRNAVRLEMRHRGSPLFTLGLMASRVPLLGHLRYCPSCADEDRALYGEAYWHRLHQLAGVLACPKHVVWLEDGPATPAPTHPHLYFAAEGAIPYDARPRTVLAVRESELVLDVARRAQDLIGGTPIALETLELRRRYTNILAERGLATYGGRVRVRLLDPLFSEFFPPEAAELFGLGDSVVGHSEGWLLRLLSQSTQASHTLHHLLLQAFLEVDRADLAAPIRHFGEGPWPCLNRVSSHYLDHRITDVRIDLTVDSPRRPIGTFACSCGFVYRRTGPDRALEDHFRITKMAAYGAVWKRALRRVWSDPNLSLRGLSERLGFDTSTVLNQAEKLGLPRQRPGSKVRKTPTRRSKPSREPTFAQRRKGYRNTWRQASRKWPDKNDKEAIRRIETARFWLRRHDREWYERNKAPRVATQGQRRVDWAERDTELASSLSRVAQELLSRNRPVNVSRGRLYRELGVGRLLRLHIDKLPQCEKVLYEMTDTRETFAIRRIHSTADRIRRSGEQVAWSTFRRMAGIRTEFLASSDEVSRVFEQTWNSLAAKPYVGED